jgi:hypothetical protein
MILVDGHLIIPLLRKTENLLKPRHVKFQIIRKCPAAPDGSQKIHGLLKLPFLPEKFRQENGIHKILPVHEGLEMVPVFTMTFGDLATFSIPLWMIAHPDQTFAQVEFLILG